MRLDQVVNQRLQSFGKQLRQNSTGFKIEKDKCAMLDFFQSNDINIPKVIGIYHDRKDLYAALNKIKASSPMYNYPLFLKGCHLTQGSDRGTVPAFARNFTQVNFKRYLIPWVDAKWDQRPQDRDRPWTDVMNRLLARLEPGIAIQTPFRGLRISPDHTPLEVKVEVVWGRAYLGLFPEYHDIIALRNGEFEYTNRDEHSPEHWTLGNVPDTRLKWLQDRGHMEAVWALAEKVARRIGIDEIRVDIFIDPERPESPAVNEVSLSSGHNYLYHSPYLAAAWSGPHLALRGEKGNFETRWPKPKVRQTSVQVHEQTLGI